MYDEDENLMGDDGFESHDDDAEMEGVGKEDLEQYEEEDPDDRYH